MNYRNVQGWAIRTYQSGRRIARAWRGITIASLAVVVLLQAYGPLLQTKGERIADALTYTAEAWSPERVEPPCTGDCLIDAWLEIRTAEILEEQAAANERRARIQALQEFNDRIPELAR